MPDLGSWTEHRVETWIGNLLRTGVLLAGLVVLAGAVVYLAHHGREAPRYHAFVGEPSDLRHVRGILADARTGEGRGLIQLGLLLLVATPVARVAFSAAAFAHGRDRLYVGVTLFVLATLVYSLVGGP